MEPLICIIETPERNPAPPLQRLLARRALANLLLRHFGIRELPDISYMENGKPVFTKHREIHFSLSHCRSAVMAAVCDREVGCDIEEITGDEIEDLLETAFSPLERSVIIHAPHPHRALIALWTAKEAYVKRYGDIPDDWRSVPSSIAGIKTIQPEGANYAYSYF